MIVCSSSVMAARGRGWAAGPGSITVARLSWPHFKYCVNNASAMFNRTTLIILVVALAAGLGLLASQKFFAGQAPAGPAMGTVKLFPHPRELPPFSLRQSDGTQLEPGQPKGYWPLVCMGLTYCPDVSPTTLHQMGEAQKRREAVHKTDRR